MKLLEGENPAGTKIYLSTIVEHTRGCLSDSCGCEVDQHVLSCLFFVATRRERWKHIDRVSGRPNALSPNASWRGRP